MVHLYKRKWIEETTYPHFTMIGQSLGSMYLAWEALCKFTPSYYFDTSGYAFTYPLARLFGCKVICYTHYPTISSDMLSRVRQRSSMYNNDALVAKRFGFQIILLQQPININYIIAYPNCLHNPMVVFLQYLAFSVQNNLLHNLQLVVWDCWILRTSSYGEFILDQSPY